MKELDTGGVPVGQVGGQGWLLKKKCRLRKLRTKIALLIVYHLLSISNQYLLAIMHHFQHSAASGIHQNQTIASTLIWCEHIYIQLSRIAMQYLNHGRITDATARRASHTGAPS
ncbi:MAG: hypothetical protein V4636_03015 [Pseudomonadota bacterium]